MIGSDETRHVRARIEAMADELTGSEAKLCSVLLADYPFAGLEPIAVLSDQAGVSAPSISRFVNKIGFGGFQDFQRQLISELKEGQRSPLDLHQTRRPVGDNQFADFVERATAMLAEACQVITQEQFNRLSSILGDRKRRLFVIGGRLSDTLARYLSWHLKQIRPDVHHLEADPESWPYALLGMRARDVVLIIDFRRYQRNLEALAHKASVERKAHVVLMTDKWISPVSRSARDVIALPIDVGTAWDSYVAAMALIECVVSKMSEDSWQRTDGRLRQWDAMRL